MQWVLTTGLYFHHRQGFPRTLINRLPPSRTLDLQFHWFLQLFLLLLPSLPQQNALKCPTGLNKPPQHIVRKGITFLSPQINFNDCYKRQKNLQLQKKNLRHISLLMSLQEKTGIKGGCSPWKSATDWSGRRNQYANRLHTSCIFIVLHWGEWESMLDGPKMPLCDR